MKKILIIGDSGRGKTTFAKKLSEKLSIPIYDTDDFFWKVKYTVPNDIDYSISEMNKIFDKEEWIVSGSTRRLIRYGIEKADIIFYLRFKNILTQSYFVIRRAIKRGDNLSNLFELLLYIFRKKYKKGYGMHAPKMEELLLGHDNKTVEMHSFREINNYLNSI